MSKSDEENLSLTSSEVLDLIVLECHDPKYCHAHKLIDKTGIVIISADIKWMHKAGSFRSPSLSFHDVLNLHYAKIYQRTLVTNSKCLRSICWSNDIKTICCEDLFSKFT
jgi:hypothetical protein